MCDHLEDDFNLDMKVVLEHAPSAFIWAGMIIQGLGEVRSGVGAGGEGGVGCECVSVCLASGTRVCLILEMRLPSWSVNRSTSLSACVAGERSGGCADDAALATLLANESYAQLVGRSLLHVGRQTAGCSDIQILAAQHVLRLQEMSCLRRVISIILSASRTDKDLFAHHLRWSLQAVTGIHQSRRLTVVGDPPLVPLHQACKRRARSLSPTCE